MGFLLDIKRRITLATQKWEKVVPGSRIVVREVKDELVGWRERALVLIDQVRGVKGLD